ncbi:hypothetical protein Arth_4111 [Arthrobacter sp. FB24]|nr:hypothetical protein Arth_4111 [Arthrobacter sp. FB24]
MYRGAFLDAVGAVAICHWAAAAQRNPAAWQDKYYHPALTVLLRGTAPAPAVPAVSPVIPILRRLSTIRGPGGPGIACNMLLRTPETKY